MRDFYMNKDLGLTGRAYTRRGTFGGQILVVEVRKGLYQLGPPDRPDHVVREYTVWRDATELDVQQYRIQLARNEPVDATNGEAS